MTNPDVLLGRGCRGRAAQVERQRVEAIRNLELLAHQLRDHRVLARSCGGLRINPLRVIHNLGAVEAKMQVGGDKAWDVTHCLLRRTHKEFDQFLSPLWLDRVGVDQGELAGVGDQLRRALVYRRTRLYDACEVEASGVREGWSPEPSADSPLYLIRYGAIPACLSTADATVVSLWFREEVPSPPEWDSLRSTQVDENSDA